MLQWYAIAPAVCGIVALLAPVEKAAMFATPGFPSKVTSWGKPSEFVQVTEPPLATRAAAGLNLLPLISTLAAAGAGVVPPPPPPPVPGPVLSEEPPQASRAARGMSLRRERMILLMGEVATDQW